VGCRGLDDDNVLDRERRRSWHGSYGVGSDGGPKPDLVAPGIWLAAPMLRTPRWPTRRRGCAGAGRGAPRAAPGWPS
jgi:serine protease AprX